MRSADLRADDRKVAVVAAEEELRQFLVKRYKNRQNQKPTSSQT